MSTALEFSGARSFDGLWPDEAVRRKLLRRYEAMNASYQPALVVELSRRGFFFEVNIVIHAALFALERRRRLAVSERSFNGLRWSDFFASELPAATPELVQSTPLLDRISKPKVKAFGDLMLWVRGSVRGQTRFRFAAFGIDGGLFEAQRSLYRMFCRPTPSIEAQAEQAMAELGLEPGQFAAIHLRPGDQAAEQIDDGRPWSEGETTPMERIAEILRELSPTTHDVFVLTDDFAAVGELQAACPDRRVVTLCPPQQTGHDRTALDAETVEARAESIGRLLAGCLIAARSDAFAGGFKSNLVKFVTSIHVDPGRCVSTDSQLTPWPHR